MKHLFKILSGPLGFLAFYCLRIDGLTPGGQIILATFIWVLLWWVTQPVPWGIASLLPLVIFPMSGIMDIGSTASLYGQNIFFWIMGLVLLGYAMQKHGLARRFAIGLLSIRGVGHTTHRLLFFYMLAGCALSMFISDAAVVAIMIPIGLSVLSYVRTLSGRPGSKTLSQFGTSMSPYSDIL